MSLCLSLCPLSSVFGRSPAGVVEKWELGWAGVVGRGRNSQLFLSPGFPSLDQQCPKLGFPSPKLGVQIPSPDF